MGLREKPAQVGGAERRGSPSMEARRGHIAEETPGRPLLLKPQFSAQSPRWGVQGDVQAAAYLTRSPTLPLPLLSDFTASRTLSLGPREALPSPRPVLH